MKKSVIYTIFIIYMAVFAFSLLRLFNPMLNNFGIVMLYLFLVFLNTGMIIKIMIDYDKYGDKISPFKKVERHTYNEMIIAELSKLNTYQKTLIVENNLIVINEAGVFEFVCLNKQGILKGDIKDEYWLINNKKIKNPFILKNGAFNYIILNSRLTFKVSGVWLTTRRLLYNTVDKRLNKKIYTKDNIDKLYLKLSNSVKL